MTGLCLLAATLGPLDAIGLGTLQGLTEFLPISSSGHLSLIQYFLGLEEVPRFFDVMLHVGTLAAVVIYYRQILWPVPSQEAAADSQSQSPNELPAASFRMLGFIVLATLPAVAAALIFRPTKLKEGQTLESVDRGWRNQVGDLREYSNRQPWAVVGFLGCTSMVLMVASRARGGAVDAHSMKWWHALAIGMAQALSALFPGLSRSGMTISTSLLLGLRGEWAVHFSLLMSIPAILGAAVLKTRDLDPAWLTPEHTAATVVGTIASTIVGWFCITLLVRAVRRGRWWWFSVYLWILIAVITLALMLSGSQST